MALTPAQSEQIVLIRNQLVQMMTAIEQIARETGVSSMSTAAQPMATMPPMPLPPTIFFEAPGVVNGVPLEPIVETLATNNTTDQPQEEGSPDGS